MASCDDYLNSSSQGCQCSNVHLNCTDLCNCCDSKDICGDSRSANDDLEEDEDYIRLGEA